MPTKYIKYLILLMSVTLSACNSDIFIDDAPPSDKWVSVGVGEERPVSFQTTSLQSITLSLNTFSYGWTIYDIDGNSTTYQDRQELYMMEVSSSLPFISRVVAVSEEVEVEFIQNTLGHVTIRLLKNISGRKISGSVRLGYSYKVASVDFTLEPEAEEGAYFITSLIYNGGPSSIVNDYRTSQTTPYTILNQGSSKPIHGSFCPETWCMIMVRFDTRNLSAFTLDSGQEWPEVEIPTYVSTAETEVVAGGFHGTTVRYSTEMIYMKPLDNASVNGLSFYAEYPVEVPPESAMKGQMTLSRIIMAAPATMRIHNPVSGRTHDLPTTVTVVQPFFYTFHWQKAPIENEN